MAEKVPLQKQSASPEQDDFKGATLAPPAFQLAAGEDSAADAGGQTVQTQAKDVDGDTGGTFATYNTSNTIVTIPKNAKGTLPILVIVGGINYATKEWMKTQIPSNLFNTHILSFSNHGTGYTKMVKPDIEAAMSKEKVQGSYKAIIGFSKGGERVNLAKSDENWSFLGMIDPSVPDGGGTYPHQVLMVWNVWGSNSLKEDNRSELHEKIQKGTVAGQSVRAATTKHENMPKLWFSTYAGSL